MPVVALVSSRAEISGGRARSAGFAGVVLKPYSPRELHAAIQSALARTSAGAVEA